MIIETTEKVERVACPVCKGKMQSDMCRFCNGKRECAYVFGGYGYHKLMAAVEEFKAEQSRTERLKYLLNYLLERSA
jgi:hypothetical protein